MIKKYSKPVLCEDIDEGASLYKPEFSFDCSIEHKLSDGAIRLFIRYTLISPFLESLLESGEAALFCKIRTKRHTETFPFSPGTIGDYRLDLDLLDRIDSIQVSMMIVASHELHLSGANEWIDDISSYAFDYCSNELLALATARPLSYAAKNVDWIKIAAAPDRENKGLKISSAGREIIQIQVGPTLMEAYQRIQRNVPEARGVANSFLAFNAIYYALQKAIYSDDSSTFLGRDWFEILSQNFEHDKYDDLSHFIDEMKTSPDPDVIFEVVQSILSNSLEVKLIEASKGGK